MYLVRKVLGLTVTFFCSMGQGWGHGQLLQHGGPSLGPLNKNEKMEIDTQINIIEKNINEFKIYNYGGVVKGEKGGFIRQRAKKVRIF